MLKISPNEELICRFVLCILLPTLFKISNSNHFQLLKIHHDLFFIFPLLFKKQIEIKTHDMLYSIFFAINVNNFSILSHILFVLHFIVLSLLLLIQLHPKFLNKSSKTFSNPPKIHKLKTKCPYLKSNLQNNSFMMRKFLPVLFSFECFQKK